MYLRYATVPAVYGMWVLSAVSERRVFFSVLSGISAAYLKSSGFRYIGNIYKEALLPIHCAWCQARENHTGAVKQSGGFSEQIQSCQTHGMFDRLDHGVS